MKGPSPKEIVFNTGILMQVGKRDLFLIWWETGLMGSPMLVRKPDGIGEILFTESNLLYFRGYLLSLRLLSQVKQKKNQKKIFIPFFLSYSFYFWQFFEDEKLILLFGSKGIESTPYSVVRSNVYYCGSFTFKYLFILILMFILLISFHASWICLRQYVCFLVSFNP